MCTNGGFKKFLKLWKVEAASMVAKIQHTLDSGPMEAMHTLLLRSPSIEKHNIIAAPSFIRQTGSKEQDSNNDDYECKFYEYAALMHEIEF